MGFADVCFLIKLLATCTSTNIMLIILNRTDFHRSQKTKVIPTCMGYCGQTRILSEQVMISITYCTSFTYGTYCTYVTWNPHTGTMDKNDDFCIYLYTVTYRITASWPHCENKNPLGALVILLSSIRWLLDIK